MEKFYIVDVDSTLGKAYQNYKTDSDLLYKTYLDFAKEKGITSDGVYYYVMPKELYEQVKQRVPYNVGVLIPAKCGTLESIKKAKRTDRTRAVNEMLLMMFRSANRDRAKT